MSGGARGGDRRRGSDRRDRRRGSREEPGESRGTPGGGFALAAILLSGFASLVYQIVWVRRFAVVLGTTNVAVTLVLAAFLGGLGLGAMLAGRTGHRLGARDLVRRFVRLEVATACLAALLPAYVIAVRPVLAALYSPDRLPIPQATVAALFLLPAAALMGATLPTLAAAARRVGRGTESRLAGRLYAANTFGALAGAVLAARLLVPELGLLGATAAGVVANLAAAALVFWRLGRRTEEDAVDRGSSRVGDAGAPVGTGVGTDVGTGVGTNAGSDSGVETGNEVAAREEEAGGRGRGVRGEEAGGPRRRVVRFGAVAAMSGFSALAAEVGWSRLAALLFGPTIYTFACVVAAVILGTAVGSWLSARFLVGGDHPRTTGRVNERNDRRRTKERTRGRINGRTNGRKGRRGSAGRRLAACQLVAATGGIAVAALADDLVLPIGALIAGGADSAGWLLNAQFLLTSAALLVPCAALGASFPLAVAGAAETDREAGRPTGAIYAWTAGGNLVGALAAGFLLIPWFGIRGALFAAIALHLVAAVAAAPGGVGKAVARAIPVVGVALGGLGIVSWDREMLGGGLYKAAPEVERHRHADFLRRGRFLYFAPGAGSTVAVRETAGERALFLDGKVDASDGADMLTQRMLAHLPLTLAGRTDAVFIVGHGSGVTAGSALRHDVKRVVAAEISPEVIEASRLFERANRAPWLDDRFRLLPVDARNHLLLSDERYDIVISEPSNPWMSGVSPMFTVEFFRLARGRLNEGGLFCQWIHLYNLDPGDLRTVVGSFTDVFPETALFVLHSGDALLLGARDRFPGPSAEELEARIAAVRDELGPVGIRGFDDLRRWLTAAAPNLAEWAREADRHSDDRPVLEFRAPASIHRVTAAANRRALEAVSGRPESGPLAVVAPEADADGLVGRARGLLSANDPGWALDHALRALALDPGHAAAAEFVARAGVLGGRVEEADAALRDAFGRVDEAGEAAARIVVERARLLHASGRTEEAAGLLQAGPASLLDLRDAVLLAAEVQAARGELAAVEALALSLLRRDPRDAAAAAWLAEISLRRGEPAEAAQRAGAILEERPGEVRALRVRAVALAEAGDAAEAERAFGRLTDVAPEAAIHWANRGAFERGAGRFEAAVLSFREAVDRDPENYAAYEGLLEAAVAAGDRAQESRARAVLRGRD